MTTDDTPRFIVVAKLSKQLTAIMDENEFVAGFHDCKDQLLWPESSENRVSAVKDALRHAVEQGWTRAVDEIMTWVEIYEPHSGYEWMHGILSAQDAEMVDLFMRRGVSTNPYWLMHATQTPLKVFGAIFTQMMEHHADFVQLEHVAGMVVTSDDALKMAIVEPYLNEEMKTNILKKVMLKNNCEMLDVLYTPERAVRAIDNLDEFELSHVLAKNSICWSYINQRIKIDRDRQLLQEHTEHAEAAGRSTPKM